MSTRLVQLSDCHLFTDTEQEIRGVQSHDALVQALEHVTEHQSNCDYLVISGDLAHDEQRETYQVLREMLGPWMSRVRLIPGNHDCRRSIHEVFSEIVPAGHAAISFEERLPGWTMLGLDSHVPGEVHGQLSAAQWQWVEDRLAGSQKQSTIIFLHHPPFSVESVWLDAIALRDSDRFMKLLNQYRQVRVVCCGHVHQEFQRKTENVLLLTTPSVTIQFRPKTEKPENDSAPPGYRVFDLHEDGTFETHVVRL